MNQVFRTKVGQTYLILLILVILSLGYSMSVRATHLVGGDLTYERLGPNKYEITLNYYFDCDGSRSAFDPEPKYEVISDNCGVSKSLTMDTSNNTGNNIAPLCSQFTSSCNGGTKKGIERWVFKDTVNLNQQCSDWLISWSQSKRTNSITTIDNPGNDDLYLETRLDNKNYPKNNSPYFTNDPLAFACKDQTFTYNHGAKDPEGDSLVYSFYEPKTSSSLTVDYLSGYSYDQPVKSNKNVTIDKNTGNITMKPTKKDITVLGVKVKEYDTAGNLKGVILRDIQVIVQSCNSPNSPNLAGFTDTNEGYKSSNNTFDTTVCPGKPLNLFIAAKDKDVNDSLFMSWNNGIPDAKFKVMNDSSRTPVGQFKWVSENPSSGFGTRQYSFTVSVRDNNCSYYTKVANGYSINVIPSKKVDLGDTAYVACDDSLLLNPKIKGADSNYTADWNTGQKQDSIWIKEPGKYWVTVSDAGDCAISDTIIVLPSLDPDYDITPTFSTNRGCINDTLQFYDSSKSQKSTVKSWYWEFGDGDTASIQNPQYKYRDTGDYNVKLIITDGNDCQDTVFKTIAIDSKPNADFSADPSCSRNPKTFKDRSSTVKGEVKQSFWRFGDGKKDTALAPPHVYQESGTYTVRQIAETGGGCRDTFVDNVEVKPNPKPGFVVKNPCKGQTTVFQDTSSIKAPGNIAAYSWSFSDGTTSNKQSPKKQFNKKRQLTAQLLVRSKNGCRDSLQKQIEINEPVGNLAVNADSFFCRGDSSKVNTTISTKNTDLMEADFDQKSFGKWDTVVNGTISDACSAESGKALYFSGDDSRKIVTKPYNVKNGGSISFYMKYGTGADSCDDPERGEEVVLEYSSNGGISWNLLKKLNITQFSSFFKVTQTITGDAQSASTTFRLRQIDFTNCGSDCYDNWAIDNFTIRAPRKFDFTWQPTNGVSDPKRKEPKLSPDSQTTYTLTMRSKRDNCYISDSLFVESPVAVQTGFTTSAPDCKINTIQFNDTSIVQNGSISKTQWALGDGTTTAQSSFNHVYDSSGQYNVSLTNKTKGGCKEKETKTITVLDKPTAYFSYDTVCEGTPTKFQNQTDIPNNIDIDEVNWYSGDKQFSSKKDPTYQFDTAGIYRVELQVYAGNGCKDTFTDNVKVKEKPRARFAVNDSVQCIANNLFQLDNQSSGAGNLSYQWEFGNGDTANTANPNYSYDGFGDYPVKLLVIASNQCRDSFQQTLKVAPKPNADFTNLRGCIGDTLRVNDQSTIAKGSIQQWYYRFGDGHTGSKSNPAHYYQSAGEYKVRQTVTSGFGCKDSVVKSVIVYGDPGISNIKNVTVKDDQDIRVRWEPIPEPNPGRFVLERATGLQGFKEIDRLEESQLTYRDTAVKVDDTVYTYRVRIIDSCGNIGGFSKQKGTSIKLSVTEGKGEPVLNWSPYRGWPVKHYEVQKEINESNRFKPIDGLSKVVGSEPSVVDKFSPNEYGQRCYRIEAKQEADSGFVSVSNTDCLERSMEVYVPNAFSPNNDGHNDVFRPNGKYVVDYKLRIYNRWGEKLFESRAMDKGWDGIYEGEAAPAGTYLYSILAEGPNGEIQKYNGSFHLLR